MSAYLYILHDIRMPRVRALACHEPFQGFNSIAPRHYDLNKSCLVVASSFAQACAMKVVVDEALLQGYSKQSYAEEESFPDAHLVRACDELSQQFPDARVVQDILSFSFPEIVMAAESRTAIELQALAIKMGATFDPDDPFVGNKYLAASTATKTQTTAAQAAFMRTVSDIRAKSTFLALMNPSAHSKDFVHDTRRCLVGVFPKGAVPIKTLSALHVLNDEKLEPTLLWKKYGVNKVCRFGRLHARAPNAAGQVLFELEFKDPAQGDAYRAYPKYPNPKSPCIKLPADEAWYIQAGASAAAHELLQLPLGIAGWDVPLMSDAYTMLTHALNTPVKLKRAARKGTPGFAGETLSGKDAKSLAA